MIVLLPNSFAGCNANIHVIVKIESADSIPNLHSIISASDGVFFIFSTNLFIILKSFKRKCRFNCCHGPYYRQWLLEETLELNFQSRKSLYCR